MSLREKILKAKLATPQKPLDWWWPKEVFQEFTKLVNEKHKKEFIMEFHESSPLYHKVYSGSIYLSPWTRPNEFVSVFPFCTKSEETNTAKEKGKLEDELVKFYTSPHFAEIVQDVVERNEIPINGYFRHNEDLRLRNVETDVIVLVRPDQVKKAADAYWGKSEELIEIAFDRVEKNPIAQGEKVEGSKFLILSGISIKLEQISHDLVTGRVVKDDTKSF